MTIDPHGAVFALACWSGYVSAVDIRTGRLPDAMTASAAVAVMIAAAYDGRLAVAVIGGGALAATYTAGFLVSRGGIGAGDVKLAVSLGAVAALFGSASWLAAASLAPVATVVVASLTRRAKIPHGPSMCAATLVAIATLGT